MLNRLLSLFQGTPVEAPARKTSPASQSQAVRRRAGAAPAVKVAPMYPPDDQGLELRTAEDILQSNDDLIKRLRLHAAAQEDVFRKRYVEPMYRLADHINVLPGSASSLFAGEGGLIRACMELGFFAFQASDGRIFTGSATVEVRHKLEPRWRYICFAAGLLYPFGEAVSRMAVTSKQGAPWPKFQQGLTAWSEDTQIDRVYVSWPGAAGDAQATLGPSPYATTVASDILGRETLSWLDEGSPDLTRSLFEIIGGSETRSKIAQDVVTTMWGKVKSREEARRPQAYGRLTVGTHLTPYLVGAAKQLIADGVWTPNELPLIVDSTGVYLVWPQAGQDIVAQGSKEGREGWPSSASTLAELLKQAGVFDTLGGNDLGMIEVVDDSGEVHASYRLQNPNALIDDYVAADYVKAAPKTLDAVIANDPLLKPTAQAKAKSAELAPKPAPLEPVAETPEVQAVSAQLNELSGGENAIPQDAQAPDDDEEGEEPELQDRDDPTEAATVADAPAKRQSAPSTPPPAAQTSAAPAQTPNAATAKISEAPDVRYADLVPEDIRKEIRNGTSVEILGKVIKAWGERDPQSTHMRMVDTGAALSVQYLTGQMRSMIDWVNDIAAVGLVYSPPATPGLKVQKIAIPEGSKPRDAIVISRYGCKKLGMN